MTDSDIGCVLSEAFLKAVSAVAGFPFTLSGRTTDNAGIDASFFVNDDFGGDSLRAFDIKVQIKHTSQDIKAPNGVYGHSIEKRIYDMYREERTPNLFILVLLVLPHGVDINKWLQSTKKQLSIKGPAYYSCIRGYKDEITTDTTTVHYKKSNILTVDKLKNIAKIFACGKAVKT